MPQTDPQSNIEIDFLPKQFREQSAERKNNGWRVVVIVAFTSIIIVAALLQRSQLHSLRTELDNLKPQRTAAQALSERLGDLREQYEVVQAKSQLATYLRHPWPRAQVLHAVLAALPETVTLTELSLHGEVKAPPPAEKRRPRGDDDGELKQKAKRAELRDLDVLHAEYDDRRTIVILKGTADEFGDLHEYLEEVARHPLVATAELVSAEQGREEALQSGTGFELRIRIRVGYGLPDGPKHPPAKELVGSDSLIPTNRA